MVRLSVNLNKVALIRNSRGPDASPSLLAAAISAIDAGCCGLTLHPRFDERHATLGDIKLLSGIPRVASGEVELNIEGDARPALIDMVKESCVHQFTLVPVTQGERTTERGWEQSDGVESLKMLSGLLIGVRLSLFIDPEESMVDFAHAMGFHAVEFHTKKYAQCFSDPVLRSKELSTIQSCADHARSLGLKVNLGHDLNTENIGLIVQVVMPDEVSIGHSLISEALMLGLGNTVGCYLKILDRSCG